MAIEVGNVFEGRVTGVKPFGAFVALPEGRVGMVHISEVSNEFVQDIAAVLHDGDIVKVQVINIAPDGKIALSIKRLLPPPPPGCLVCKADDDTRTDWGAALRKAWKRFLRRLPKLVYFTVPVYVLMYLLQIYGFFNLAEEWLAAHMGWLSFLKPQAMGIIVLHLAAELGADVYAAKRAGLLHDIGKAVDHEMEGTHVALGVEFLRKYHEKDDIIHAVQAHHNDVEPQTIVACLVQAADAISAARPENLENYIKRLEQLEEITGSYPGVDKAYAIQAGREVRVMVKPDQVSEDQMVILARELAKKIEEEMEYPGQIKVHVLRETTAIEYAK